MDTFINKRKNQKSYYEIGEMENGINKNNAIDIVKLLCAVLVVAMHTTAFGDFGKHTYDIIGLLFYGFPVPFFFITSGFFFGKKFYKTYDVKSRRECIKKYMARLFVPYIFWGTLYFCLASVIDIVIEHKKLLSTFSHNLWQWLVSSPGGGMWYVQAILCLLLLMWIFATKPQFEKFLFCILAICVFIPNTVVIAAQHSKIITTMWDTYMSIFLSTNNFLFHGVFFILGLLLYKNMDELKKMPVSFCLVVMLITGCIQFFLGLKGDTTILGALFRKLSCFMFYLFIFISAYKSRINISAKISVQIRRMSNMIYFMHFTFIYAAKILFSLLGISVVDNYTWMFVMVLLTLIVLSAMINSIEEKKKIKLKIF